jgi:hypothetical protein
MRQSSFAARHRVSLSEEHEWVDRSTIEAHLEAHLEVEMGTETAAGRPDGSNAPLRPNPVFLRHIHSLEVCINRGEAACPYSKLQMRRKVWSFGIGRRSVAGMLVFMFAVLSLLDCRFGSPTDRNSRSWPSGISCQFCGASGPVVRDSTPAIACSLVKPATVCSAPLGFPPVLALALTVRTTASSSGRHSCADGLSLRSESPSRLGFDHLRTCWPSQSANRSDRASGMDGTASLANRESGRVSRANHRKPPVSGEPGCCSGSGIRGREAGTDFPEQTTATLPLRIPKL